MLTHRSCSCSSGRAQPFRPRQARPPPRVRVGMHGCCIRFVCLQHPRPFTAQKPHQHPAQWSRPSVRLSRNSHLCGCISPTTAASCQGPIAGERLPPPGSNHASPDRRPLPSQRASAANRRESPSQYLPRPSAAPPPSTFPSALPVDPPKTRHSAAPFCPRQRPSQDLILTLPCPPIEAQKPLGWPLRSPSCRCR